uniref:NADP-dependent oxidoreductase domain-containing protein n=1 Tax=Denticeps clupeoides TaxID=299321 RepID=A0AAY4DK69_9TELE
MNTTMSLTWPPPDMLLRAWCQMPQLYLLGRLLCLHQNVSPEVCQAAAETAIAAGYRHLDTAYMYQNEAELGRAIRFKIKQGIIRREDMFITSKVQDETQPQCQSADFPGQLMPPTLKDLQLDYLDLYLVHFPVGLQKVDDELFPTRNGKLLTNDIDYVDGMEALQLSGKVRSIGVSNFNVQQLQRLLSVAKVPPAVNQVEMHPYLAQSDLVEFCRSRDIALTDPVVADVAKKHRRSSAQVLLRYHVQQGIAVIPKSIKPNHILDNSKVFDFSLDEEDMKALRRLDRGWRACVLDQ